MQAELLAMSTVATVINHFTEEKEKWAALTFAKTSGILTGCVLVSYWPIFPLSLVIVPEVFAKVKSSQFSSRFYSGEWFCIRHF